MLRLSNGDLFTEGMCAYRFSSLSGEDSNDRILIPVSIENVETEVVLDTGGIYLICNPELARRLDFDPQNALDNIDILIPGHRISGALHKANLEILADEGNSYNIEVTAFIPEISSGREWTKFPAFMGLRGCLELFRFAVDPGTETFHFGPIPWESL